jgi:enoyl-CoA hydratase/carnithine racemase
MNSMDLTTLRLHVADGIATVTLDRPPVNAQNRKLREELLWLFDTLSDRADIRAIILTGAGKASPPAPTSRNASGWCRSRAITCGTTG